MLVSMNSQIIEENPALFTTKVEEVLQKLFFIRYAYEGFQGNILSYLYFCLIFIVPFVLFLNFISKNILAANGRSKNVYINKNFKLNELKTNSQTKALALKEIKRYFNTTIYVINTIFGPVMCILGVILIYLSPMDIQSILGDGISFIFILLFVGAMSITTTTACSISIEGKQFWILKSLPVKTKQVFWGKLAVNLIITLPVIIIGAIICTILYKLSIIDLIFIIIIPTLMVFYISYMGLFINLAFPRFDYDSDVKVVKQSLSVLLTLLLGMISVAVLALTYFYASFSLSVYPKIYMYLLITCITLILYVIAHILLFRVGNKLYNKLNC